MNLKRQNQPQLVVFLGPDGAGKSTLLAGIEQALTQAARPWRSYYFAPGFLKRYRPRADNTVTENPHEGRQYKAPLIFAKLSLLLVEFGFGIPQARRQNLILLFDRYISDILVDPVRYRMHHSRWWMRLMLRLAPRPDLLVIITAPADIIQARKQEVSFAETERQVEGYKALAAKTANSLIIENTGAPEAAVAAIIQRVLAQ